MLLTLTLFVYYHSSNPSPPILMTTRRPLFFFFFFFRPSKFYTYYIIYIYLQLGLGDLVNRFRFLALPALRGVPLRYLAAGTFHSLAVTADGSLCRIFLNLLPTSLFLSLFLSFSFFLSLSLSFSFSFFLFLSLY